MQLLPSVDRDVLWQMVGHSMAAVTSQGPGIITRFAPGAWRVTCDVDSWTANWIVCHGRDETSLRLFRASLDEAVASSRNTSVVVAANVRDEVVPVFAEHPMKLDGVPPMMWRDGGPLPPNPRSYGGDVRSVAPEDDVTPMLDLWAQAFEVDPAGTRLAMAGVLANPAARMYVANSDALDSACVTFSEANVTYIHILATDPGRQQRGAGRAVLTHAMEAAIRDGTSLFYLMASSAGQPLYRALGYETYELPEFWEIHPHDHE